eukprot:gene24281-9880_t
MSGNPPIPKLPGYTVSLPASLGDKTFKKGQTLGYINGYQREEAMRVVDDLPSAASTGSPSATMQSTGGSPAQAMSGTSTLPQWVENDRKVLRFYGYFKESVTESNIENHRIRKVVIYYYLEDDSMQITEPKQDNSGIPQGNFVKRHKLTKDDGSFFTPNDFMVGTEVTVYGRTFFLTDADSFTREKTFGLSKGPGEMTQRVNDFKSYIEARLGKASHMLNADDGEKLRKFLENNKKVLRFWCVWDDRQTMFGDRRPYILHYFLENDTVEILEVRDGNNGRDPFPALLKRAQLPKVSVKTATGLNPKYAADQCYTPADLRLGAYVDVQGRDFLLHDCDTFTKQWYAENMGYSMEEMTTIDVKEIIPTLPKPALPPHNGYGTLEDSVQNCLSLQPKPPRRDMHKLMNKDKIVMRFTIKMIPDEKHTVSDIDEARRLILSFFLMDDTLQLFEPPSKNSGISGGKFLERQRVFKPQSEEIYTCQDLYVGSTVLVYGRTFELLEADEYTYTYMENNKHIFIMADHEILIKSLKAQVNGREEALRTALIKIDRAGSGSVSGNGLEESLRAAGLKYTRHQAVSLIRRLDKDDTKTVAIEDFLAVLGISS